MTRIVTTHYRYKRPPRKRKAVAIEAPAIAAAKSSHRPRLAGGAAAEVSVATRRDDGGLAQPTTPRAAAPAPATPPANDDRKSAIVTARRRGRFGDAPDMTPEEHQRRGAVADALWRELVRRATSKRGDTGE
jgi:hypothetical protein